MLIISTEASKNLQVQIFPYLYLNTLDIGISPIFASGLRYRGTPPKQVILLPQHSVNRDFSQKGVLMDSVLIDLICIKCYQITLTPLRL